MTLSPGRALMDPADDRLERAPFAEIFAKRIIKASPLEGFVMALQGGWGTGKTTILNFIKFYLRNEPEISLPIIVEFNPWWFSGDEELIRHFFDQLEATLSKSKVIEKKLLTTLDKFARVFEKVPAQSWGIGNSIFMFHWLGGLILNLPWLGQFVTQFFRKNEKDLNALKDDISDSLKKQNRKILVIIDDIDRLDIREIIDIFKLVKSVADFPNVLYLMAYDRSIVTEALGKVQGGSGSDYLEKIVQASFELPLSDRVTIENWFLAELNALLDETPDEFFDKNYWGNVFLDSVRHFLQTPRQVTLLLNAIEASYPSLIGEANATDFVAIETLRMFAPAIYELIRNNQKNFVGIADNMGITGPTENSLKTFHEAWLQEVVTEKQDAIKNLVLHLFPMLEVVWGKKHYDFKRTVEWNRQHRVCSDKYFSLYFRFFIQSGEISNFEMKTILELCNDPKTLGKRLVQLAHEKRPDGATRLQVFLDHLEDYTEHIDDYIGRQVPMNLERTLIPVFFDVGEQLEIPDAASFGRFDPGIPFRILRIIHQLFPRFLLTDLHKNELRRAFQEGNALSLMVAFLEDVLQEEAKARTKALDPSIPVHKLMLEADESEGLKGIVLEKIAERAQQDSLLDLSEFRSVLSFWKTYGGDVKVREWVSSCIANPANCAKILEHFLIRGSRSSAEDKTPRSTYKFNPRLLEAFVDLTQLKSMVVTLLSSLDKNPYNLSEIQKIAVQTFMTGYQMIEEGKDPSDHLNWLPQ